MAFPEACLHTLSGVPHSLHYRVSFLNYVSPVLSFSRDANYCKRRDPKQMHWLETSTMLKYRPRLHSIRSVGCTPRGYSKLISSHSLICKCQRTESDSGLSVESGTKPEISLNGVNGQPTVEESEAVQKLNNGKEDLASNRMHVQSEATREKVRKTSSKSIEDEAWDLLQDSIAYYCNNPIGTIAANDPSCQSILNYDQVFIRDFIPSGIAFLLKGEFDIVRNFILHTLQLQVLNSLLLISKR